MKKPILALVIGLPLFCLLAVILYYLPPIHSRLAWRVDEQILRVKYALNPPEEQVFIPQQPASAAAAGSDISEEAFIQTLIAPTLQAAAATATASVPTATPTATQPPAGPTATPAPSATPTIAPTPLPPQMTLTGVRYEDQHGRWNYCAPANLSMALSYWGWEGDRDDTGKVLKPVEKDKNVMPYEMADYVEQHTDYKVFVRLAGDADLLKRFIAAGYPVLIEKGTYLRDISGIRSWMGHYEVVTGYDDVAGEFIVQDSYVSADLRIPYDQLIKDWRAFNYTYLIIYAPEKEAEVVALLGEDADETANYQRAALKASNEVVALTGIDQYFAWFNRGSSLVELQDYAGAAAAYDEAFANVYPTIPADQRPWRMMWYQTGPYFAYFYSQRYWDVLNLATTTLDTMQSDKNLEESYYWRGMAKAALGDSAGAIEDFQTSLTHHPGFEPTVYQLGLMGIEPQ